MVIQAYTSTNNAMDEEKDKFYNQLQDSVASCSSHDMIVVMGDLNIKVGSNNINREEVMGKFGVKSWMIMGKGYVTSVIWMDLL